MSAQPHRDFPFVAAHSLAKSWIFNEKAEHHQAKVRV